MLKRTAQGKYISDADITGDAGIAFIHSVASEMRMLWRQHGAPEAGIDGHIEIRDPDTGRVRNFYVMLQSKAGQSYFERETPTSFQFTCDERDLDYWMDGNVPVILVVSRNRNEGYWMSIKDYFRDPAKLASRKISFDKQKDKFDERAAQTLADVAVASTSGIHLPPIPKREILYTNFVPVLSFPKHFYVAPALAPETHALTATSDAVGDPGQFVIWDGNFMSFDRPPVGFDYVDEGAVEEHETSEYSQSDDPNQRRGFVHLLNRSLQATLAALHVDYHSDEEFYWFTAVDGVIPREFPYAGLKKETDRFVVQRYSYTETRNPFAYVRHSAAYLRFERYDETWGLLINPTYHFTADGSRRYEGKARALKKIKLMEKNRAVLGQTIMWARLLKPSTHLFSKSPGLIQFADLKPLTLSRGIEDDIWRQNDDSGIEKATDTMGGLFDLED